MFVFSSVRRNVVGDVEGERIWIGSDVCVVGVVGEPDWDVGSVEVENVESWIWALVEVMLEVALAGSEEPEELDLLVRVGMVVVEWKWAPGALVGDVDGGIGVGGTGGGCESGCLGKFCWKDC